MEENHKLDEAELLIDFNSPVSRRSVLTPLIPVPTAKDQIVVSPTNSNPFDVVARQTDCLSPRDPFEHVFNSAFFSLDNYKTNDCEPTYSDDINSENILPTNNNDDLNISPIILCNAINLTPENSKVEQSEKIEIHDIMVYKSEHGEDSFQSNTVQSTVATVENASKLVIMTESDSQSQASDFSTEEGLKAVIAKRVNKCIQNVLKNNFNCRLSKSKDNLNEVDDGVKSSLNRSLSFLTQSSAHKGNGKQNKSSIEFSSVNCTYNKENENLTTSDSSMGLLNYPLGEISNMEDSAFLAPEKEVFEEANKLARTFSRIAESFCNYTGSDNEDDLISCKPRWFYTDSSEDEEEKLRNDPALNIRVSLTNSSLHAPDSPALVAFKSRNRRSLDFHSTNSIQESGMKRSHSTGSKINAAHQDIPAVITSVPVVLLNPEEKQIKLKKKPTGDTKKGPMKAMIPVQSMTKESIPPLKGKTTNKRDMSPVSKQNSSLAVTSPNQDTSQIGLKPVASSTPTKAVTVMPSLLTPTIEIPSNHRRSLGSTLESRKSRTSVPEEGAKQRSSSANSSIPTPVVPPKALKGLTSVKSFQKPRSTSSLPRVPSNNTKANSQRESKPEKKTTKQTKSTFNPRALNEMKSQTSHPAGRVKSAVNAISTLVSGKGKKAAVRDKENRVPV